MKEGVDVNPFFCPALFNISKSCLLSHLLPPQSSSLLAIISCAKPCRKDVYSTVGAAQEFSCAEEMAKKMAQNMVDKGPSENKKMADIGHSEKALFETELDLLLYAPEVDKPDLQPGVQVQAGTTPSVAPAVKSMQFESATPHSRKRSAAAQEDEEFPAKRIKAELEDNAASLLHIHPARRDLVVHSLGDGIRRNNSDTAGNIKTPTYPPSAPLALRRKAAKNTIQRQWDPSKDSLDYETLLDLRRKEQLSHVDRYVPGSSKGRRTRFSLERLPEKVLERVFEYLLVGKKPITMDCYWLRSFIRGHAREPNVMQKVETNGSTYSFPIGWNQLLTDVDHMKEDMSQFKKALELREAKTRATRAPCRGLSTALLKVSRKLHKIAAKVFYGKNAFKFPCASSAWIQLDSFLITIGSHNAKEIRHLQIHAPMWHRFIQEDFVEGAMIDCLSPATRLAVMRPSARDRVLAAIENATRLLSTNLKTLVVELANPAEADKWTGRYVNDKRMIAVSDAEEHAGRKATGIELLKTLSARFPEKAKPTLTVYDVSKAIGGKKGFQKQLHSIKTEAAKYGWYLRSKT